jgi:hypothetical protein
MGRKRGDWVDQAIIKRRRNAQALNRRMPTYSMPLRDTATRAPGWLFVGEHYSCIPDAQYPWDPAVVKAIQEFCPDAVPILIKSLWQRSWSETSPLDHMQLVRHGIARCVRDPLMATHQFYCEMPANHDGRVPNYIEVNWYDRANRPWGHDLPGEYLPFDWELYYALRMGYEDSLSGAELARKLTTPWMEREERRRAFEAEERAYRDRDLLRYYREEPSDVELKRIMLGDAEPEPSRLMITVPGVPG